MPEGTSTFVYDIENGLVGMASSTGASPGVTIFYDPLGRLFSLTASGVTTEFLYDGDALVGEYIWGNQTERYVHGSDGAADDPLLWYHGNALGDRRSLHGDHQGSIVAVSNSAGAMLAINRYDEYGVPAGTNTGRFQYTGQIWLGPLGMYHYKARIYSPYLGRFLQTDPVGYDDQFNLYAYVGNDPVNMTDSSGMAIDPPTNTDPPTNNSTCGSRVGVSASCSGQTIIGLNGSSGGIGSSQQSHIGMNGFPQDGPPPEMMVDGDTMTQRQDSHDMRDVMAQRMTQARLMERREARALGAAIGSAPYSVAAGAGGIISLTRTSIHGSGRLAGANATRGGVLSYGQAWITRIFSSARYVGSNGTNVYVRGLSNGRFNVAIWGRHGYVTSFRNIRPGTLNRLAARHGWQ